MKCQHCNRTIELMGSAWIDPNATGDDDLWRYTCDHNDTFTAEHEPKVSTPRRRHGCLLWPVLNDDSAEVDYWEVYAPCPEDHAVRRSDGTVEQALWLDCCHSYEPEATGKTLAEASEHTYGVAREYYRYRRLALLD